MKKVAGAIISLAVLGGVSESSATVLFQDSFSSASYFASNWNNPYADGIIAAAPGGGNALTFTQTRSGGSISTTNLFSSGTGLYTITFDFIGNCGNTSGCGAFFNTNGNWILSDTPYGGAANFPDSSQWETVSYTFNPVGVIYLGFENYLGSPHAGPQSFYIKNLSLTDDPNGLPDGTLAVTAAAAATTPLPSTWLMLLSSFVGLGFFAYSGTKKRAALAAA